MTNEELYRQYLSGDAEAFEQLYLQMQGFIASVAKDAAQSFGCAAKETLDELTPFDVFNKRLEQEALDEALRAQLDARYRSIVTSLQEGTA